MAWRNASSLPHPIMLTEPLNDVTPTTPHGEMRLLGPLVSLAAAVQFLTIVPPLVPPAVPGDDEMGEARSPGFLSSVSCLVACLWERMFSSE